MKSRMNSQMKKLFAALITVSVVVSLLSGCGGSNGRHLPRQRLRGLAEARKTRARRRR